MKRALMCCVTALALSAAVNAAPVTCSSGPVSLTGGGSSPTITCGGLTFSNFHLLNMSGDNSGTLDITSITFDAAIGMVTLNENPNLGNGGHANLLYTVTGPVNSAQLSVGGTLATVIERACGNPIPTVGVLANLCTNTAGDLSAQALATLIVHSGDANQPVTATLSNVNTIYVYKDIGAATGGSLNSIMESFGTTPGSPVPEPATAFLIGSALVGVGMIRRRTTH